MRCRGLALVIVAAGLAGCSASADDGSSNDLIGGEPGGQTGSLRPVCGYVPGGSLGASVPAGDSALVVHTRDCEMPLTEGQVTLIDGAGNLLPVQLVPVDDDGALLVRTDEYLAPGRYEVTTPGDDDPVTLEVTDPEPLPERLGTLEPRGTSTASCGATFELTLSPEAVPYAPLMKLTARVDDREVTWVDYGLLDEHDGVARLYWRDCERLCLGSGRYELEVKATIAGEEAAIEPATTTLRLDCEEETGGCRVAPRPGGDLSHGPLGSLVALAGIALWRLRRLQLAS